MSVMVLEISNLLTNLYVEVSEKCRLYSVECHEIGLRAHPMFLSVTVKITSLLSGSC